MKPTKLALAFLAIVVSFTTTQAAPPEVKRPATLPPIASVKTDERGFFHVNGKPFFPILLYDLPITDAAAGKDAAAKGFNVLTVGDEKQAAALLPYGFYGAIHGSKKIEDGKGVLILLSLDSPALEIKENLIAKTQEHNAKAAANLPGRPVMNAIGYWLGEPQGVKDNTLPGKDKYEELVAAIDVSAPYLYPVPYQPVSTVGDAVKRAHDATGGKKPLLPILQLFSWEPTARYPTPAELRCMVYQSLIEGATGIGYYSYNSVKDAKNPLPKELWESVGPLNNEVAKIGAFLAEAKVDPSIKLGDPNSPVKLLAAIHGNQLLVLLVNPTDQARDAAFTAPDGKRKFQADTYSYSMIPFGTGVLWFTVK